MYGRQVGENYTDPEKSWIARYPEDIVARNDLENGNIDIEFRTSGRDTCRVFYEVSPETHRVVSWRFKGHERDCTWIGP